MVSILYIKKWAFFFYYWNHSDLSETVCSFSVSYDKNYPYAHTGQSPCIAPFMVDGLPEKLQHL